MGPENMIDLAIPAAIENQPQTHSKKTKEHKNDIVTIFEERIQNQLWRLYWRHTSINSQ